MTEKKDDYGIVRIRNGVTYRWECQEGNIGDVMRMQRKIVLLDDLNETFITSTWATQQRQVVDVMRLLTRLGHMETACIITTQIPVMKALRSLITVHLEISPVIPKRLSIVRCGSVVLPLRVEWLPSTEETNMVEVVE